MLLLRFNFSDPLLAVPTQTADLISAERIKSGENTILNHRSVCQRAISISLSALNYSRLQSLSAGFALAVKIIPISRDSKHDRSLLSLMISRDSKHDR